MPAAACVVAATAKNSDSCSRYLNVRALCVYSASLPTGHSTTHPSKAWKDAVHANHLQTSYKFLEGGRVDSYRDYLLSYASVSARYDFSATPFTVEMFFFSQSLSPIRDA